MEVKELIKKKEELENGILRSLQAFASLYELEVVDIRMETFHRRTIGEVSPHVITGIRVDIRL